MVNFMTILSRPVVLIATLLALAACKQGATADGGARAAAKGGAAVATVNGQPITQDAYDFYVRSATGKPATELSGEQRELLLDNLVRAEVMAQAAEKEGLARQSETASALQLARLEVLQQAARQKYLEGKTPTEAELRAEYETQVAAMPSQEYKASHILVATEDYARRIIEKLDKGASFAELAKHDSMDGSKEQGGDLGWFTPDRMVPPFAKAVTALRKGEYTHTPVQTQFGWHVIRLEDTRDVSAPPFDSVKDRLVQIVLQKKFKSYSDELLKSAKVEKKLGPVPAAAAPPPGSGTAVPTPPAS